MQPDETRFNHNARAGNILKASLISALCNIINVFMGFGYRTIFLHFLSVEYLGLSGLFANILNLLSLAELGITTSISFRLYDPVSRDDVKKVGELMRFFKRIYSLIAATVIGLGLLFLPFVKTLIKDTAEIPPDIHIYGIYLLFLAQTASSYLFSYRQALLSADQKQYVCSCLNTGVHFFRYSLQTAALILWRAYTVSLVTGILITIILNYMISIWIKETYHPVFQVSSGLTQKEIKEIYRDTRATLLHKIGGTVLTSTDNIILAKYIGLSVTGLYSNYSMVFSNMTTLVTQIFTSFTSSLGNAHVELEEDARYKLYLRLLFLNFGGVGLITSCLYVLINDFIGLWLGRSMQLDNRTVMALCIQFYLEMARSISCSYTSACGLFARDKARPVIEAVLNIAVSIAAVRRIGLAGIFVGTIISHMATVVWREPLLLYRWEFKKPVSEYWIRYVKNGFITAIAAFITFYIKQTWFDVPVTIMAWIGLGALASFVYAIIFAAANLYNEEFIFYINLLKTLFTKRK